MKYEFIIVDEDTTKLKHKDKEFNIIRDIDLQVKAQSSIKKSKIKMNKDLTEMGMTRNDFVIKKVEGAKTIYDETNAIALEKEYERQETENLLNELCKKYTNMTVAELMVDIGLDLENEIESEKFGIELTASFMGENLKSPRESK
jgi:hypothetical protein